MRVMHKNIECPDGTGTTGERLFEQYTTCSGCGGDFKDHLVTESKTIGGHYCKGCWEVEEAAHIASPDFDGTPFN